MKKVFDYDDYVHWNIEFGSIQEINITPLEVCSTTIGLERPNQIEIDKFIKKDRTLIKITKSNIDNLICQIGRYLDNYEIQIFVKIADILLQTSFFNHAGDIFGVVEQTQLYISKDKLITWLEENLFEICIKNKYRYWFRKTDWKSDTNEMNDPEQKLYTILGDFYVNQIKNKIEKFHYNKISYFFKKLTLSINITTLIPVAIFCGWCNSLAKLNNIFDFNSWNQINYIYSVVLLVFIIASIYPVSIKFKSISLYKLKYDRTENKE